MNSRSAFFLDTGRSLLNRRGVAGAGFGLAVDLACLAIAAVGLAHLIWVAVSPTAFMDISVRQGSGLQPTASVRLAADPGIFARFDPFSRSLSAAPVEISDETPETRLNLKIRSLFASTEPGIASVRLGLPQGNDERFQEGDTIVEGVILERILSDRIVLLRRGEREVLYQHDTRVLGIVTEDGEPVRDPTPKTTITGTPLPGSVSTKAAGISGFEDLANRLQLRREVSPDGGPPDLVVYQGSDPALLTALGLELRDVLLEVNGFSLRESSLADLANRLKEETQLNFRIRRNGEILSRTVTIGTNDGE